MIFIKKIFLFIVLFLNFFIIHTSLVRAYPNLLSLHINSIEPKIECITIYNFDSIKNHCKDYILKYNDDGTINDKLVIKNITHYRDTYYLIGEYNKKRDYFNYVCTTNTEFTLPNGINWCDKKQVSDYFDNKEKDFLILGLFQDKYRMGNEDFLINYEMRYYRPPKSNPYILAYLIIAIVLASAIIVWGIISQFKPRKKARNLKI